MKKKNLLLAGILLLLLPTIVSAKDAYSIGTDYGFREINTSEDAKYASEAYFALGYNSYYNIKPTYDYMRGNNPNTGTPRMESQILFFSGHGNYDHMAFDYQKKGGDYRTGVYYNYNFDSSTGYKYAGLKSYNMRNVDLIVFAGCNTARSDNQPSLTLNAVQAGAKVGLGWSESINATAHSLWLRHFNNQLRQGKTVYEALYYASSQSYTDNNVKRTIMIGDNHFKPYTINYNLNTLSTKMQEPKELKLYTIDKMFSNDNDLQVKVSQYITENLNNSFDLNQYIVEKNESSNLVFYDFKYVINGAVTTSAYTVITENNIIKDIVDNTFNIKPIPNLYANSANENNEKEQVILRAKDKINKDKNLEIQSQEITKIYDQNTNQYKWYVRTEIFEKDSQTFFVDDYYELI